MLSKFLSFAKYLQLLMGACLVCGPLLAHGRRPELSPMPPAFRVDAFLRGERVFAWEDPHHALDEKTLKDLEFETALLPHLSEIAPSQLGRHRLRWLLTHPLLQPEDIRERQRLIQTLAAHPELVAKLMEIFAKLKKSIEQVPGGDLFAAIRLVKDSGYANPGSAQALMMFMMTFSTLAATLGSALTGDLQMAAISLNFAVMNASMGSKVRGHTMISTLQETQRLNAELIQLLSTLESAERRTLGSALRVCRDQRACNAGLHRWLGSLGRGVLGVAADASTIFNPALIAARTQVRSALPDLMPWFGALGELEAYTALASFYISNKDALTFPEIDASTTPSVEIRAGHLPYLLFSPEFGSTGNDAVFNSALGPKTSILTGPNAGGKTTYLRMIATLIILAQAGCPIPADFARIVPMAVFTNFANEKDSATKGLSTFQAQSRRVGDLLSKGDQVAQGGIARMVLMDEVLVGTSELEHTGLERAVLEDLYSTPNLLAVLATHYRSMTSFSDSARLVNNLHVDVNGHVIRPGPSTDYNALDVAEEQGVPKRVIDRAREHIERLKREGQCADFLDPFAAPQGRAMARSDSKSPATE